MARPSRFTNEEKKQVVQRIEARQESFQTAALALNVSEGLIYQWRKQFGNGKRLSNGPIGLRRKAKRKKRAKSLARIPKKSMEQGHFEELNQMALESQIARVMDQRLGRMFLMLGKVLTRQ